MFIKLLFVAALVVGAFLSNGYTKSVEPIGILNKIHNLMLEDKKLTDKIEELTIKNNELVKLLNDLNLRVRDTHKRTTSFGKSNRHLVDSDLPNGFLHCPDGYYVAGGKNLFNNNQMIDMLYCCSPS